MPSLDQQTILKEVILTNLSVDGSLVSSQEGVALTNDEDNPGANKVYGTDDNGVKGWKDYLGRTRLETTVSAATLKTVQATPLESIAAPGADKYILLERIIVKQISVNTDYTTGGNFSLAYSGASGDNIVSIGSIRQGDNYPNSFLQMLSPATSGFSNQIINRGVSLKNSSTLSEDGDSYMIIIIDYTIQDLT